MKAVTKSLATVVFVLALLAGVASGLKNFSGDYAGAWGLALICFALILASGYLFTPDAADKVR